jgi:hypothetical protein
VRALRPAVKRDRAHVERIVDLVRSSGMRPPAIELYALADAPTAHRVSETHVLVAVDVLLAGIRLSRVILDLAALHCRRRCTAKQTGEPSGSMQLRYHSLMN